ncbi:MAG: hypothetical protein HYV09_03525 [Deltaproteobacteria bacterium]|nr:hypothetical protein [Deltaproteobacteria bacterium]
MLNAERLISESDAYDLALVILLAHPVAGARPISGAGGPLHVEFQRGSAIGCSLSISFGAMRREEARGAGRHAPTETVLVQQPRIEICWSSTGRSVATATAAIALYREVTELAALIAARLEGETIGVRERALVAKAEEASR